MFDLFRSREKSTRYVLGALLLLVAFSLVVTLVPSYGTGMTNEMVIAEIGGEPLTVREVQLNIQAALQQGQIPPQMREFYVPMYVNNMIAERAVAYQAQQMGFNVTEDELALAIRSMLPQLFQDGKFVGRDAYAAFLAQQNLTIPTFEANVRKQLALTKLQTIALEGVVVTPREVEEEFRRRNEKVRISYIGIAPDRFRSQVTATSQELQEHFNANRAAYRIPEKRTFQLLVADEARVGAEFEVPEADLRRAYEQNKEERYRTPERVRARHILVMTTEKPKEEVEKLRAKAEDLLKQIKGGADFAELARKHSDDPGSAARGGDLDWIVRGQTVKNFEDTAFSLKPKEISDVITTEYGFHIIQVQDKEVARLRPFEEVRGELVREIQRQAIYDRVQNLADQAQAELRKTPREAAQIADRLKLQLITVREAAAGTPIPEVGSNPDLDGAIHSLGGNEVSDIIQVSSSRLAVAVVTDVHPARDAELSEVEAAVRNAVIERKATELSQKKIAEATEKLQAVDGDIQKLARELGLEVRTTSEFTRTEPVEGIGEAAYVQEAFTKPVGSLLGPLSTPQRTIFVKVLSKAEADMSKLAEERATILEQLKGRKARARQDLFNDGVLERLIKEGKVKINENSVQRLIAAYRS
ncbi:MAG: peptidylprolyl isomerase [Bryobacteraceae bacterium]